MQVRMSRASWGAAAPRSTQILDPSRVSRLFVHHTTGAQRPDVAAWVRSIQRFHQLERRWADIAYSWLVDRDGVVWEGRGWRRVGAHTRGFNSTAVAVAYLGDGSGPVPAAALRTIRELADEADREFGRRLERLGHRDVGRTACPGDVLYGWVAAGMPVEGVERPKVVDEPAVRSVVPDLVAGYRRLMRDRGWSRRS